MSATETKIRKEWIIFFVCLMLLLLIWQKLQLAWEPPHPAVSMVFRNAATDHDLLHDSMLASLEKIDLDRIENPDESQLLASLHHNLKKCRGISVARNEVIEHYDSDFRKNYIDKRAFRNSLTTVAIVSISIILVLMLLAIDSKPFSWKKIYCLNL